MYNTIIIDDNVHFVKNFIEILSREVKNVRVSNIATDGIEAVEKIKAGFIDIVFLDIDMPRLNGIEVLKELNSLELFPLPVIIIISGESKYLSQVSNNKLVNSIIYKGIGMDSIIDKICDIINDLEKESEKEIYRKRITAELKKLNFNLAHKGTNYLREAIEIINACRNQEFNSNLEKNIYPIIAAKHQKSIHNVKSNILKAINYMYRECEINNLKDYFYFSTDRKPTPKLIIFTIYNKICK